MIYGDESARFKVTKAVIPVALNLILMLGLRASAVRRASKPIALELAIRNQQNAHLQALVKQNQAKLLKESQAKGVKSRLIT